MGEINGIHIGTHSIHEIIRRATSFLKQNKKNVFHIANLNPETYIIASERPEFRNILNAADEHLIDGVGIKNLAETNGIPSGEKLAGTDLMALLVEYAARNKMKVFFLGGEENAARGTLVYFRKRYPGLRAFSDAGSKDVLHETPAENRRVINAIKNARPDFLFVAYGPPKQELWIDRNKKHLGGTVCMGVGGSFNFISGRVPRAPRFFISSGFEWAWRFAVEPKRFLRKILPYLDFWLLLQKSRMSAAWKKFLDVLRDDPAVILLSAAIFLIRIPPVNPPVGGVVFLSTNIARFLIGIAVLLLLFGKKSTGLGRMTVFLTVFYVVTQSLSVLHATSMESFLLSYKNLIFSVLLFPLAFYAYNGKYRRLFFTVLLAATGLSLLFEFAVYLSPALAETYFKPFLYDSYWQFLSFQISRNRFFGDSFEEVLVPLLFFLFLFDEKRLRRILSIFLIAGIILITLVSNWRTKFIMLCIGLLGSLILYRKLLKKYILPFLIAGTVILVMANQVSLQTVGSNIYDLFLYDDSGPLGTTTTESRLTYWQEAAEMGLSSPLTGVGLGNFYDNLTRKSQTNKVNTQIDVINKFITIDDPHDVFVSTFAYTGVLGLGSFLILLGYFAVKDVRSLFTGDRLLSSLILSFWCLFVFSVLNPSASFTYLGLFWVLRGFIEKKALRTVEA